jgi:hypothetical protein
MILKGKGSQMKIVALYKTFRGEEFLKASIRSIYRYVDKIVLVNSETAWTGRKGNTCKKTILQEMASHDPGNKIVNIDYDTMDQVEQCAAGFHYIKDNLDCDYIMLIDSDEVWDRYNLEQAFQYLRQNNEPEYVYKTGLYTYIKSVHYRVDPVEPLEPVVFVSPKLDNLGTSQRCYGLPSKIMHTDKGHKIRYHHFVYVRYEFNTILEKIISSHVSEDCYYQDMSQWISQVWNKLPHIQKKWEEGIHPAIGFQRHWKKLITVSGDALPEVFTKYPELLEGLHS